jgi:hypothetical protein
MSNPIQDTPQPVDGPTEVDYGPRTETVKLTQHVLGMEPYVLIRAVKVEPDEGDPDDDGLRLKVEHNNQGPALATMFVLNLPVEQNPITAAIKSVLDANGEHPDYQVMVETLGLFADFCDVPMPESGK